MAESRIRRDLAIGISSGLMATAIYVQFPRVIHWLGHHQRVLALVGAVIELGIFGWWTVASERMKRDRRSWRRHRGEKLSYALDAVCLLGMAAFFILIWL
jgi:hypothetical protein